MDVGLIRTRCLPGPTDTRSMSVQTGVGQPLRVLKACASDFLMTGKAESLFFIRLFALFVCGVLWSTTSAAQGGAGAPPQALKDLSLEELGNIEVTSVSKMAEPLGEAAGSDLRHHSRGHRALRGKQHSGVTAAGAQSASGPSHRQQLCHHRAWFQRHHREQAAGTRLTDAASTRRCFPGCSGMCRP